jgi:hypothetical protein
VVAYLVWGEGAEYTPVVDRGLALVAVQDHDPPPLLLKILPQVEPNQLSHMSAKTILLLTQINLW